MKKLLGVLLLIGMFNMNMQAAEVLGRHLQALERDKMLPVDLKTDHGIVRKEYKKSDLNRFFVFNDLFDDDDKPLCIPLGKATPEEFDLFVRMADPALEDSQRKLPQVVRDDREALLRMLWLARLFDPKNPKTLYPVTMGLLKKIEELPEGNGVDGNPRESELARWDGADIVLLLDNFTRLINDSKCNEQESDIKSAVRLILGIPYLRDTFCNNDAELLIEGIKKRAVICSNHSDLIERIREYVFDDSESENKFPVVPDNATMRPASDFFPLSVQDLITADVMPELIDNNTSLDLRYQGLTCLSGLSNFRTLRELCLSENNITTLPVGVFVGLTQLQWLGLVYNQLTTLPVGVFVGLTQLQRLDLNINKLRELPVGLFTGLTALQRLYLGENQLRELPDGVFAGLTQLRSLNLYTNNLITLPVGLFTGLTQLQELSLSRNKLRELPVGSFTGLTALRELDLSYNNLTTLEPGTFAGLMALQELFLYDNKLRELPVGVFTGLTQLKWLDLDNNKLTTLPVGVFAGLTQLKGLHLDGKTMIQTVEV